MSEKHYACMLDRIVLLVMVRRRLPSAHLHYLSDPLMPLFDAHTCTKYPLDIMQLEAPVTCQFFFYLFISFRRFATVVVDFY